jgi:hypothetical protein
VSEGGDEVKFVGIVEDVTVTVEPVGVEMLVFREGVAPPWVGWRLYTFRRSGPPQYSEGFARHGILQPVSSELPSCSVALLRSSPHQHSACISNALWLERSRGNIPPAYSTPAYKKPAARQAAAHVCTAGPTLGSLEVLTRLGRVRSLTLSVQHPTYSKVSPSPGLVMGSSEASA